MKKRFLIMMLALSVTLSMAGCGIVEKKEAPEALVEENEEIEDDAESEPEVVAEEAVAEADEEDEEAEIEDDDEDEGDLDEASDRDDKDDEADSDKEEKSEDKAETDSKTSIKTPKSDDDSLGSIIKKWKLDAQPKYKYDNHTNVSMSNVRPQAVGKLPDDAMGSVFLAPQRGAGTDMLFGTRELTMYFQRPGVVPGEGTISIYKKEGDIPICSVNVAKSATAYSSDDGTFTLLGWEPGTRMVITLPYPLDHDERYYVTADAGCFVGEANGNTVQSKKIKKGVWEFDVAGYGIIPELPSGSEVYLGGSMQCMVYVHGRADSAEIVGVDENRITVSSEEIERDYILDVTFEQLEDDGFGILFWDDDGNMLGQTYLTYKAVMPPKNLIKEKDKDAKKNEHEMQSDTISL